MADATSYPDAGTQRAGRETEYLVFVPEILPNPYDRFRLIREHEPIFRNPRGIWRISRFRDARFVLRDARFGHGDGSAQAAMFGEPAEIAGFEGSARRSFTFLDPPDHTRLRNLVSKAFTPRAVLGMEPRIREIAGELADELAGSAEADLVGQYAYPLPMTVICELLGIPEADRPRFRSWTALFARSLDTNVALSRDEIAERERMRLDFLDYARELVDLRRRRPGDDLISKLVAAQRSDDLSMPELLVTVVTLISAGYETTVSAIANCALALLSHPEQLRLFREHPERTDEFLDELLRYDPPVHHTMRVALDDVEIDGHRISAGDLLVVMLGAANRDPELVNDPDRLDLTRPPERHLVFGLGIHYCLGAQLARIELRHALRTLFQRFPEMRLASGERKYRKNYVIRTLAELPVFLR